MNLLADLHTHTIASGHGYSTALEVATSAAAKGLELIAITDHGPSVPQGAHPWYFWNLKVVPSVIDGVQILKGCEANIADTDNGIDLPNELLQLLDFVSVGFHPLTGFDERDRDRNTAALMRAIANPFVDQITHPGNESEFPLDLDAVVAAAAEYRVILELNDHSFAPTSARAAGAEREREFAAAAVRAGAPVAIGSDAHFAFHVGRFSSAIDAATALGLTRDEFVNRDGATVLDFLTSKRERPRLGLGGSWTSDGGGRES